MVEKPVKKGILFVPVVPIWECFQANEHNVQFAKLNYVSLKIVNRGDWEFSEFDDNG